MLRLLSVGGKKDVHVVYVVMNAWLLIATPSSLSLSLTGCALTVTSV